MGDPRVLDPDDPADECFLLSLDALAVDWNRPEEDEAWAYLQHLQSTSDGSLSAP
jgi:hypothetical protein